VRVVAALLLAFGALSLLSSFTKDPEYCGYLVAGRKAHARVRALRCVMSDPEL
jgi:hypothetical protein